jgi:hypothetical protein
MSKRGSDMRKWMMSTAALSVALVQPSPALAAQEPVVATNQSAAGITYYLPRTKATLTANLVLKSCDYVPTAAPTVAVVAAAEADDKAYSISGPTLQSWRLKRDLDITLSDANTISAINSTVSDRTASIIGGVVKFVASLIVPLSGGSAAPTSAYRCNAKTKAAIAEVSALEEKILELRGGIAAQKPADVKTSIEIIDALAARIAALRTGPLLLTMTKELDLSKPVADQPIELSAADLRKWFELPVQTDPAVLAAARVNYPGMSDPQIDQELRSRPPNFRMTYSLQPVKPPAAAPSATAAAAALAAGCPGDQGCQKTLVFREPVMAKLTVHAFGSFVDLPDKKVFEAIIPVGQWGMPSYLSMGTKVLQTRSVNLTFDGFGRKKSFGWKSEAKGEALATGLGTVADSVGSYRKAFAEKSETERDAALVTALETKKKLNALLACSEILDAGGYTCPGTE